MLAINIIVYMFSWYVHYHIMALATDSISVWLRYEVKYSMLLRLNSQGA